MRISRKATFLGVIALVVILSYISFVSAEARESCSCGCTYWGGGTENNLANTCIPKYISAYGSGYLTSFIYGYNPSILEYIRECRSVFSSCSNYSGCCGGKCFDLNTEKCCANFYISPAYPNGPKSPPDNSGLVCGKYETCADANKDGVSDSCLGNPPAPLCPSAQDLGSCKSCDANTGVISDVPSGAVSGSCSGTDLGNDCNELKCDGKGGCTSSPNPNLCTPSIGVALTAKVGDLVVDDYNKLKDLMDEVSYSQIFPPKLNCNAVIGSLNSNGNFIPSSENSNVKFEFFISNSEQAIYSDNLICLDNCGLDLPEDYAKLKIKPSETVWCKVTRDSESQESNSLVMPDFYLYIKSIKAFNVLEDFPLVAGKPLGVSVYAYFKSKIIMDMDIDVPVRLKYASAGKPDTQVSFKPMKEFNLDEVKNRIKQNPDNPDEKDLQILKKVKNAEESANFFQLPVPNEGTISISAEINSQSAVAESMGYDDNSKTESFSVVSTRKLRVLPVDIILRDYDKVYVLQNGARRPIYVIRDYPISTTRANSEYLAKEMTSRGMDMVETLYPIAKSNVEILPAVTIIITRYTDANVKVYTFADSRYFYEKSVSNKIFSNLVPLAEKYRADYAIGIIPGRSMATSQGFNRGIADDSSGRAVIIAGPDCPANKSLCLSNERILSDNNYYETLAHEFAHINGIFAGSTFGIKDYPSSQSGIGASNGWVIDQTTGNGKIPRINIWVNPGDKVPNGKLFDLFSSGEILYHKTAITSPSRIVNLDLLMGAADAGNMFVYKDQYQKLLDNYKGNSFKYNLPITGGVVKPIINSPAPKLPVINPPVPVNITPKSSLIPVVNPVVNSTNIPIIPPQIPLTSLIKIITLTPPLPNSVPIKNASISLINPPAPVARPIR